MSTVQKRMYINGEFVENTGGKWIDVVNPATEQVISQIPEGSAEDARRAIDAAEAAQPGWEALPAVERGVWLHKIAAGIREREAELTDTIIAEGGKPTGWRKPKCCSPRIISITWLNGRAVTKAKSFRATVPTKTSLCSAKPSV